MTYFVFVVAFQDWCFSFSYYMYGYNMGALAVRAGYSGLGLPYRWFWYGNKGARWEHQSITIHAIPRLVVGNKFVKRKDVKFQFWTG